MGSGRTGYLLSLLKTSAPGKIILFGEHAVVYNRPALAVPITQIHVDVEVLDSPREGIWIDVDGKRVLGSLKGLLKKEKSHAKNIIAVGDFARAVRTK